MEGFAHQLDKSFHETITLRIIWSDRCQPESLFLCILLHFITGAWMAIICSGCLWIAMSGKTTVQDRVKLLKTCKSDQINFRIHEVLINNDM